jgi:DNA polymerase III epsilon subunit-like protein
MYLFLDTETTGVTPNDHVVSICCAFYDPQGQSVSVINTLIRPEGFEIPWEATSIHGITTERALEEGRELAETLDAINAEILLRSPGVLVGHNVNFDIAMVGREYSRKRRPDRISGMRAFCTMKGTANLLRLPGKYGSYKWPKLDELHRFVFGIAHQGAHDARADVEACARCFFELKKRGQRMA